MDFSIPYAEHSLAAMSVGESPTAVSALRGKRLGLIARNDAGRPSLPATLNDTARRSCERFDATADALCAGELDALPNERQNIGAFIADGHPDLHCSLTLERVPVAVALPKASPELRGAVNAVTERLTRDGERSRLAADSGLKPGD